MFFFNLIGIEHHYKWMQFSGEKNGVNKTKIGSRNANTVKELIKCKHVITHSQDGKKDYTLFEQLIGLGMKNKGLIYFLIIFLDNI